MNGTPESPVIWSTGLPGELPPAGVGEDFWAVAGSFVRGLEIEAGDLGLDLDASSDRPRVWLLLNRLGGEETGAVAGLELTGFLAGLGRRTLLIDADESERVLTGRSGRTFKSGWLDMARYGTSLAAAAVTVDWEGRQGYFLGLGSYCPPEITGEEVQGLVSRLQGQVDDVIVVCGMGAAAEPWAAVADNCWYCWNRTTDVPQVLQAALADLREKGLECRGVLAFGREPVPEFSPDPETAAPDLENGGPAVPASRVREPVDSPVAPLPAAAAPSGTDGSSHSSGIFRVVALTGLFVVVVLAVFIWKFTDLGRPAAEFSVPLRATGNGSVVPVSNDSAGQAETRLDSVVVARPDSTAVVASDTIAGPAADVAVPDTVTAASDSLPAVGEAERPESRKAQEDDWDAVAAAFEGPVGRDGWCLHVYSLRDSTAAWREIRMIEARGVRAVGAPVVLPDSTLWYRVYVGSFASRQEARAAEPALKKKLRTDWARPTMLPRSARD